MDSLGNVMEIIEKVRGSVPERTDLPGIDLITISEKSKDKIDCVANGYYIGRYLQEKEFVEQKAEMACDLSNLLYDISANVNKAMAAIWYLSMEYFADSVQTHKKDNAATLLGGYEGASWFSSIAGDYMKQAEEEIISLQDVLEKVISAKEERNKDYE